MFLRMGFAIMQKGDQMDDLITRQAVKDWLLRWEGYIDGDMIARMQYRVIDIPPAQSEPKRGRWVHSDIYFTASNNPNIKVYLEWRCSECGESFRFHPSHNYCPNCGAKMETPT